MIDKMVFDIQNHCDTNYEVFYDGSSVKNTRAFFEIEEDYISGSLNKLSEEDYKIITEKKISNRNDAVYHYFRIPQLNKNIRVTRTDKGIYFNDKF